MQNIPNEQAKKAHNMKKDYRGKTNWRLEDPFYDLDPSKRPAISKRRRTIMIALAVIIISVVIGLGAWAIHHHKSQTASAPVAPPAPKTISIPLQIPQAHS